jgi:hypothetical protein
LSVRLQASGCRHQVGLFRPQPGGMCETDNAARIMFALRSNVCMEQHLLRPETCSLKPFHQIVCAPWTS